MRLLTHYFMLLIFSLLITKTNASEFSYYTKYSFNDTLKIKLSWKSNRNIIGTKTNPIALIGVYKKVINTTDTVQDINSSIAYLNFPQMDTLNFKEHAYKGYKILNLNNNVYKNDTQFWQQYNLPWLEYLVASKTTIYVLSDSKIDQLIYQFIPLYSMGPLFFKYFSHNNQLIRTGFGKEIEYLDSLIKKGTYKWNETLGAYQANN